MPDELIASAAPVSPAEPLPEGKVDVAPETVSLQAEVERLRKVKEDADKVAKEAEEKAVYWRKQKAESRRDFFKEERPPAAPPPQQPMGDLGIGEEPKQEAFDDYQKYLDSKIQFEVKKAKASWDREQTSRENQRSQQDRMVGLQSKLDEGYKKYPDFEEVALDRTVPITPVVMEILAETENAHDVAYYLGKNRSEAIQIARMNPIQAAKAIARIEAQIAGASPPVNQPKIPGAPPPITPVGGSNVVNKDPDKMSQKEYEKWRVANGARRF